MSNRGGAAVHLGLGYNMQGFPTLAQNHDCKVISSVGLFDWFLGCISFPPISKIFNCFYLQAICALK